MGNDRSWSSGQDAWGKLILTGAVSENAQLVARTKSTKASKGVQQVNSDGGS